MVFFSHGTWELAFQFYPKTLAVSLLSTPQWPINCGTMIFRRYSEVFLSIGQLFLNTSLHLYLGQVKLVHNHTYSYKMPFIASKKCLVRTDITFF